MASSMNTDFAQALNARKWMSSVLVLWFVLALGGSLLRIFAENDPLQAPFLLAVAVILPVVIFTVCYFRSVEFQRFLLSLDLRTLTLAQTFRAGGVIFLILHARGVLPGVFALPAGWGDVGIGVTAPVVAFVVLSRDPFPRRIFVVWNTLGILDLAMAVSLGVLASPSPVGILAGEVTTQPMSVFPLSLIPTFLVPLFVILHLIALSHVRRSEGGSRRN